MTQTAKLRLAFGSLAIVLIVPLGLVIQRALESERAERERVHEAVAERILDEMERELNAFLAREEERPFEHYRNVVLPNQALSAGSPPTLSPLAEAPGEPFIVGYFQIEPDGTVTSPRNVGSPESQREIDEIIQTVGDHWQQRRATTRNASPPVELDENKQGPVARKQGPESESAFRELNRAATDRQERVAKVSQAPAANVYSFSSEEEDEVLQQSLDNAAPAITRSFERAVEDTLQKKANESIDVRLEPMMGSAMAAQRMMLYRTVVIDQSVYRQGILIDTGALTGWLGERVLKTSALKRSVRILDGDEELSLSELGASFSFDHRFADPFSPVTSVIVLEPLPELAASSYLVTLAALLLLTATVGLFSIYRMVAVAISFAERRQNFVSAVSHELKTPLTAIRMYGEMLRDQLVLSEDKRQRYYVLITAETERLSRLVDNVLELGRLEREEHPLQTTSDDVGPLLEEAIAVIAPHAETEGFQLQLDIAPGLPSVRFERDALSQVVFNLLDNAVKYGRSESSPRIRLTAKRHPTGVDIKVEDDGPGVAVEHVPHIFDAFYRAESELTRTAKGTGIGLALVKDLVGRMGGQVSARNRTEGGFTVRVRLFS